MTPIAIDIETIANPEMIKHLPPPKAAGNLKNSAKIQKDIQKKQKKQIEQMSLNPITNLICALGWCNEKKSGVLLLKEGNFKAEQQLVREVWELLAKYDHFITFNGIAFDIRCLNIHSAMHRIRPSIRISTTRYHKENHTDLRMILSNWDSHATGTLDLYLKAFFGGQGKSGDINGSLVQSMWDIGAKEDIGKYCECDAIDTWRLGKVVREYMI